MASVACVLCGCDGGDTATGAVPAPADAAAPSETAVRLDAGATASSSDASPNIDADASPISDAALDSGEAGRSSDASDAALTVQPDASSEAGGPLREAGVTDASVDAGASRADCNALAVPYQRNLSVAGERAVLTLLQSEPEPPAVGYNTWQLRLTDSAGAPLEAVELGVEPFMPDHGHGAMRPPQIEAQGDGLYVVQVHFSMPGYWRITFDVSAAPAQWEAGVDAATPSSRDRLLLHLCI